MRATTIMLIAVGLLILTHWANSEPAVNSKMVIELAFALIIIAMLDQGRTEPIAQGFAWFFLAAVALSSKSLLGALNKINPPATGKAAK